VTDGVAGGVAAGGEELAERLAGWIERLGLEGQLAEAGLPTLSRAEDGRALWRDPGTGAPLTAAQLADLDEVLHRQGSEPEHAVPVALVVLAQQARVREELLRTPTYAYDTLAELRGTTPEATRFAVHKAASTHRLLVVPVAEGVLVPAFQLGPDGELRPDLAPVLEPLLAARMDPWRLWAWLTRPAALLGGLVPEQAVADDPDLVLHAAVRLAEQVARG
jgi:hypothetical protein